MRTARASPSWTPEAPVEVVNRPERIRAPSASSVGNPSVDPDGPAGPVASAAAWLQLLPIVANGRPAAAAYQRGADGADDAYGIAALDVSENGIARIVVFGGGAALLATFGLPARARG